MCPRHASPHHRKGAFPTLQPTFKLPNRTATNSYGAASAQASPLARTTPQLLCLTIAPAQPGRRAPYTLKCDGKGRWEGKMRWEGAMGRGDEARQVPHKKPSPLLVVNRGAPSAQLPPPHTTPRTPERNVAGRAPDEPPMMHHPCTTSSPLSTEGPLQQRIVRRAAPTLYQTVRSSTPWQTMNRATNISPSRA
jgi:hypothetical protein